MSTSDHSLNARQALLTALGLSMATAIALGFSRFSYALLLAPMRADLGWSYLLAGAMNTANAVGYLLGALATPFMTRRIGVQAVLWTGALTACAFLIGPALVQDTGLQLLLRLLSGIASALIFITGGLLAARRIPAAPVHASGGGHFRLADFGFGLAAYLMFGVGYIGYMTFVIALLKEQGMAAGTITLFYSLLGLAVIAASRIWAGMLDRFKGGQSLAILSALLAVATAIPALTAAPLAIFLSGLLFGAVFLSVVASTTALVRHNLPPAAWSSGIGAFTTVFALGQIIGPTMVGWISDHSGTLQTGLQASALALLIGALLGWRQKPLNQGV